MLFRSPQNPKTPLFSTVGINTLRSSFLLGRHLLLHGLDALFVLSFNLAELDLLDLHNLSNLLAVLLQGLGLSLAVLPGFVDTLFNEVTSSDFNHNLAVVFHDAWDIQAACQGDHDLFALRSLFQVIKD